MVASCALTWGHLDCRWLACVKSASYFVNPWGDRVLLNGLLMGFSQFNLAKPSLGTDSG